ncbi:MAG: hypothetical protein ACRCV0_04685 [Brevinema sp.]
MLNKIKFKEILSIASVGAIALLYIFWLLPMKILSQEYTLSSYFINNNIFIYIPIIFFAMISLVLIILSLFSQKSYQILFAFIMVILILTFLYPVILSYDFGGFIDNNSLTSEKPLLGFSTWYYLLDIIIITATIVGVRFLIISKNTQVVLLAMFVFYTIEFTTALTMKIKVDPNALSQDNTPIVFSTNKQNVLVFLWDSVPNLIMLDYIKNFLSSETSKWKNDFTFYNNVASLSYGATAVSFPSMFGGYDCAAQYQITTLLDNNKKKQLKILHENTKKRFGFIFPDLTLEKLSQNLSPYADFSYQYIAENDFTQSPIFSVPLYLRIPYFMRYLLADDQGWRYRVGQRWFKLLNERNIVFEDTSKAMVHIIHTFGTHHPLSSEKFPMGINDSTVHVQMRDVIMEGLHENSKISLDIIEELQKNNIYDNTKIVFVTDHGLRAGFLNNKHLQNYIKSIDTDTSTHRYFESQEHNMMQLAVFMLIKDINEKNSTMRIDNRFLSLGDLRSVILSTFITNLDSPDYTKQYPPKRIFNVPLIDWTVLYDLNGAVEQKGRAKKFMNQYVTNNLWPYVEIKGITSGEYQLKYYPADKIGELPVQEIVTE